MNIKDIKQGQGFVWRNPNGSGDVTGHIFKIGNNIHLCQNGVPGLNAYAGTFGYKYSWVVGADHRGTLELLGSKVELLDEIYSYKTTIGGYDVKVENGKIVFGCGAYKLSKEDLRTYLKIENDRRNNDILVLKVDQIAYLNSLLDD